MSPQRRPTEDSSSVTVISDVVKTVAILLERILDNQKLQQELQELAARGSGATGRLGEATDDRQKLWAVIRRQESEITTIAVHVGSLARQQTEILQLVTPWYIRIAKWFKEWKKWTP